MKPRLLQWLRCPECQSPLQVKINQEQHGEIKEGQLWCQCGQQYPIVNFIPRFVNTDSYAGNFSFEWKIHRRTQIDTGNKKVSHNYFIEKTGFDIDRIQSKLVLDVGVGAGRYADVVEKAGGEVIGIDISYAVDAAFENLGLRENVHLIQADVFSLPLRGAVFDYVYSIGVLHHTPDTKSAFLRLPPLLKSGGKVAIWVYSAYYWPPGSIRETANQIWRKVEAYLPQRLLYALCYVTLPLFLLDKIPLRRQLFHLALPGLYHLCPPSSHDKDLKTRILDTFDWYSPKYQWKHTYPEVFQWFREAEMAKIEVLDHEVAVKGIKP